MSSPLVSIIIPFYNDGFVNQAVASALSQTYPNIEIIVVDDGSTVNQHLLDPFRSSIHYVGKANGGTASALNHGIRMSSGEYIAWLSSDDLFYPHKIAGQLGHMLTHGALISATDFDLIGAGGELLQPQLAVKFASAGAFLRALHTFCPINGCTVMMHRSVVGRIGWFNEGLRYTQDYDYWMRTILSGIDFHFVHSPLTAYRWHENSGTSRHLDQVNAEFDAVHSWYANGLNELIARVGG
ncbi:glycosyltransferase [Cohnella rhizosphaerae]|uniref:Glycosyltransferase n=1 Tax=Cohnella rhizosphaerae TaxID=1457232 RepID=A0A9X4KTL5_9BACL|nr:glycosyltransferase [Cohnella rhizosphaerae]MDG0808599.1 glycosyltransferase [Cohnella rhizosphaerae]